MNLESLEVMLVPWALQHVPHNNPDQSECQIYKCVAPAQTEFWRKKKHSLDYKESAVTRLCVTGGNSEVCVNDPNCTNS